MSEESIRSFLKNTAKNLNLEKWRFEKRVFRTDVVNYAGIFISVSLLDEVTKEEYSILIKLPADGLTKNVVDRLFETEYQVYSKLLPAFRSLASTGDTENLFPNCYYALNDPDIKVLVLQDMSSKGFESRRCGNNLNYRHKLIALEAIAKFHALSFMMTGSSPVLEIFEWFYPECFSSTLNRSIKAIQLILKDMYYVKYLENCYINFENNIKECISKAKGKVFGHGDCYKENILFKYSNEDPIEACLLDFQHTRRINLAQDVLFFIITCSDERYTETHFKDLINYYYKSLQEILNKNGMDGAQLYTAEDFNYDLKLVFPICLVLTVFSYALWFDVIDIHGQKKDDNNAAVKFVRMVDNLVSDFIKLGFLTELPNFA